jgi:hypothetical protein
LQREDAGAEARPDAYDRRGEVDVAPAKRDELAAAKPEGDGEEDRAALLAGGRPRDGVDPSGENTSMSWLRGTRSFSTAAAGVGRRAVDAHGALEDPAELGQQLVLGPTSTAEGGPPALDVLGRDVLDPGRSEHGDQPRLDGVAVVAQRGGLQPRSCSTYRSRSWGFPANVTPVHRGGACRRQPRGACPQASARPCGG